jgi:hypothetical protein
MLVYLYARYERAKVSVEVKHRAEGFIAADMVLHDALGRVWIWQKNVKINGVRVLGDPLAVEMKFSFDGEGEFLHGRDTPATLAIFRATRMSFNFDGTTIGGLADCVADSGRCITG